MSRKFTQISGLSQIRRLPRLGRIRGGVKVKKKGGDKRCQHKPEEFCLYCTRPSETPHFICPPEVQKVYGEQPTELDIMIPVNDLAQAFPQAYEMYSTGRGLKCTGDGTQALRFDEESKSMIEVPCPCELLDQKKCMQRGHLSFILPKVSVGGVYSLTTTSFHSIVDINSSLDYVTALIGRFAMVPLKLKREPRETHHDGKKQIHYTCRIELEGNIDFLNALKENTTRILAGPQYILPAPEKENPAFDDGPVYPEEAIESEKANEPEGQPSPVRTPEVLPAESKVAEPEKAAPAASQAPQAGKTGTAGKKEKSKDFKFLKAMSEQKKRVGDEAYYRVLGAYGVEHADELMDRKQQVAAFQDLDKLPPMGLGCTLNPRSCPLSKFDENLKPLCFEEENKTKKCLYGEVA